MRWTESVGREVVDTSSAEVVGRVDSFVADPAGARFTGVVVGDRVVRWADAGGVGADAVTVENPEMLRPAESEAERDAVDGRTSLVDRQVLTELGHALGEVADVEFDAESGQIERFHLGEGSLDGSRLLGVGSFCVVVSEPGGEGSREDLESRTKDELYEMAQARDIEGRSSMTKAELIDALG